MSRRNLQIAFYSVWASLAFLQAFFMELMPDEAYYWMYANDLDWGYLDHPPMVAIWIWMTKWIPGEIGVRLLMVVANVSFIYLVQKLLRPVNLKLFYLIIGSLVMVHFGFLAVPDVPLVLFSVFFLIRFRKFMELDNFGNSVILALSVALMLYSKYQGLILVLLAVVSQWGMMKRPSFYLVLGLSVLFFLPHLIWQYQHDWPSQYFHLHERSPEEYNIKSTYLYPFEQILAFGPLTGILLLMGALKYRPENDFEKTLKFIVFGLFIFLFLMTFKGPVELNWSVIAMVSLIYIGYKGVEQRKGLLRVTKVVSLVSIILLLVGRLLITINPYPEMEVMRRHFGNREWAQEVKRVADGAPVIFQNTYQLPSLYMFYTDEMATTVNCPTQRLNQYDVWNYDTIFRDQKIMIYTDWDMAGVEEHDNPKGGHFYTRTEDQYVNYKEFTFLPDKWTYRVAPGEQVEIVFSAENNGNYTFDELSKKPDVERYLHRYKEYIRTDVVDVDLQELSDGGQYVMKMTAPDKPGRYSVRMSVRPHYQLPSYNSKRIYILVD